MHGPGNPFLHPQEELITEASAEDEAEPKLCGHSVQGLQHEGFCGTS